jgi:hypothetical protein
MSKVSNEVAFNEVKDYLKKHLKKEFRRNQMPDSKIEDEYLDLIEAVEDGLLIFDKQGKAVYKLRDPLDTDKDGNKLESADLIVKEVKLKSRIKAADKHVLMDGLNVQKQLGTYTLKIISYITQLHEKDIKRLEKDDFDVLNQLCSVF